MKQQVKVAAFLSILCLIGMLSAIPYMSAVLGNTPAAAKVPLPVVLTTSVVQQAIIAFLFAWLGLIMGKAVGLDAPILRSWITKTGAASFQKREVLQALTAGIIGVVVIIGLEFFVFRPFIPEIVNKVADVSPLVGMLTFLQGGVFEEVELRLFLMTLIVWILFKLFGKKNGKKPWMFYIGIIVAALLFGIGHLPAVQQIFGSITPILFVRTIVLNGLLGLLYGYLYWKKGLEYGMITHAIGDIILHGFLG